MKPWTRIISARGRGRRGHALFFVKSTGDITTNESNDLSIKIQKRYLQPKQNSIQKFELTEPWFFLVELNLVVWKEEKNLFLHFSFQSQGHDVIGDFVLNFGQDLKVIREEL